MAQSVECPLCDFTSSKGEYEILHVSLTSSSTASHFHIILTRTRAHGEQAPGLVYQKAARGPATERIATQSPHSAHKERSNSPISQIGPILLEEEHLFEKDPIQLGRRQSLEGHLQQRQATQQQEPWSCAPQEEEDRSEARR